MIMKSRSCEVAKSGRRDARGRLRDFATPRLRYSERGMTLAETISVIGIMTVVLLIVTQIFIINYDVVLKQTSRIDNDLGAVFAVRRISDATRGASAVVASRTINGTAYTTGASTLILELPGLDVSSN